jgi:drug/metabolite transporter (DMT)-like permease
MHTNLAAIVLSLTSAALLGAGAVIARVGIRYASARTGASISVPITTVCFWLLAPLSLRLDHASLAAAAMFATIGLFFPASVTLLNFESARRLGPSIASALGTSTALFSAILAVALLHERPSIGMLAGTLVIASGVASMTLRKPEHSSFRAAWLALPIAAALIRASAQIATKHALTLWASPFAASLLSYSVSAAVLFSTRPAQITQQGETRGRAIGWFAAAGLCNGASVLAMYAALDSGPVTLVAPLATTAPLFAVAASALVLREERIDGRLLVAIALTVIGAALLVMR